MLKEVKTVVFDMDGTLIDSMPAALRGLHESLEAGLGERVSDETLHRNLGLAPVHILQNMIPNPEGYKKAVEYWNNFHTKVQMDDFKPFEGVVELMDYLQSTNIPFAILTGRDRQGTLDFMHALGWYGKYFDESTVAAGDETWMKPKPAPDGVLHYAKTFDVPVENVLMVGDSAADMLAGSAAGAMTAGVLWDFPPGPESKRSKFKKLWERFDGLPCDMRLETPLTLVEWLKGTKYIDT